MLSINARLEHEIVRSDYRKNNEPTSSLRKLTINLVALLDQELLESIAEAKSSLQDAKDSLEEVGKRYVVKVYRPWVRQKW